jgi:phosphomethylpyrimidine synthase
VKTYMELAREGGSAPEFVAIADAEGISMADLSEAVGVGRVAIVPNRASGRPVALGAAVRSKVFCNFGTSSASPSMAEEIQKARIAVDAGAAILCDQSVGQDIAVNRKALISSTAVPIAAVPLYQNVDESRHRYNHPLGFPAVDVLRVFEEQIEAGVSAPGIHSMTRDLAEMLESSGRLIPVVSRGGALMHEWMKKHHQENPYFAEFAQVLEIVRRHNVPLTFVCSVRSGTVCDGLDSAQGYEWSMLREYIREAHLRGVSVVVDGLGHMAIDQIPRAVERFKELCYGVPLGALGPAVTDRGLGHEHLVHAIGTAVAVWSGANYCNACYRTEHLGLPEIQDIREGIMSSVIAVYSGDLARSDRNKGLLAEEKAMSLARRENQWGVMLHHAIDCEEANLTFQRVGKDNREGEGCSICGDLCPFVVAKNE